MLFRNRSKKILVIFVFLLFSHMPTNLNQKKNLNSIFCLQFQAFRTDLCDPGNNSLAWILIIEGERILKKNFLFLATLEDCSDCGGRENHVVWMMDYSLPSLALGKEGEDRYEFQSLNSQPMSIRKTKTLGSKVKMKES